MVERQEDNVDRRNYRVSFQKIRERLGFECKNSVESGIEEIRDALTSGLVDDFRDPKYSNLNYLNRLRELGAPVTQSTEDPRRVVKFVRR